MGYSKIEHMRIAISNYCHLKCKHCYASNMTQEDFNECEKQQMSIEMIKEFIDMLINEFELEKVSITGGEPLSSFVWPRTREILTYCLDRNLNVQLNTSGSGEIMIDEIVKAAGDRLGNILLHASLDGVKESTVDDFRGIDGAFRRARKTIEDAVSAGITVQTRYTMTSENYLEAQACYDLVTEIGADSFMIKPIYMAGNAKENKALMVDAGTVKKVQKDLLELSRNRKTRLDLPQPVYVGLDEIPPDANVNIINCVCGVRSGYVTYDGYVYPCTYIAGVSNGNEYSIGNIKDKDFDFIKAWKTPSSFNEYRKAGKHVCTSYEILKRQ